MKSISSKVSAGVRVTLQRPQERNVVVQRTARLGMNLNYRKGTTSKPWVSTIEAGKDEPCLIEKWNKENPHHMVSVHDRVISVNGKTYTAAETVETLRTATGTLSIKFVHFD
ncbi:unnamed protein product [Effrenium voratum]|nr:unnamed protein product [Effrenium voratum]